MSGDRLTALEARHLCFEHPGRARMLGARRNHIEELAS
jgi:hypothetical protein